MVVRDTPEIAHCHVPVSCTARAPGVTVQNKIRTGFSAWRPRAKDLGPSAEDHSPTAWNQRGPQTNVQRPDKTTGTKNQG